MSGDYQILLGLLTPFPTDGEGPNQLRPVGGTFFTATEQAPRPGTGAQDGLGWASVLAPESTSVFC